jgi:hypothetical protein
MNKDALLATIIGFGIGLVITGLVFAGPTIFKNFPKIRLPSLSQFIGKPSNTTKKPNPTPRPNSNDLVIESPLADSIEAKPEVLVSGRTSPNATVVIEGESDEAVVIANAQGAYAGSITLGEGKNEIIATSYGNTKVQKQNVTVFYTPEKF